MARWYCLTHGTKHMPCCPNACLGALELPKPEPTAAEDCVTVFATMPVTDALVAKRRLSL